MTPRKKLIIALSIFITLSVIAIISAIIFQATRPSPSTIGVTTVTADPTTGEEVISVEGRVAEGELYDGVLILGLAKLNQYGLSNNQTTTIKDALAQYASNNEDTERISIDPNKIIYTINQDSGQTDITTEIVINQTKRQKVVLSYVGLNDMLVRMYDTTDGTELFSSADDQH